VAAVDAAGHEMQVYYVQDAGLAVSTDVTGDSSSLPPPNVPISCTLRVFDGGKVVVTRWTRLPIAASRSASIGSKRLAVYHLSLAGGDCGNGAACTPACSADSLRSMLLTDKLSMANFYLARALRYWRCGHLRGDNSVRHADVLCSQCDQQFLWRREDS
jgi:hypothetical protein